VYTDNSAKRCKSGTRCALLTNFIVPRLYPARRLVVESRIFPEAAGERGRAAVVLPDQRGMECHRRTPQADALSALQRGRRPDSARLSLRLRRHQSPAKNAPCDESFVATATDAQAADEPSASGSPTESDASA